jgi:hypothetical protein
MSDIDWPITTDHRVGFGEEQRISQANNNERPCRDSMKRGFEKSLFSFFLSKVFQGDKTTLLLENRGVLCDSKQGQDRSNFYGHTQARSYSSVCSSDCFGKTKERTTNNLPLRIFGGYFKLKPKN